MYEMGHRHPNVVHFVKTIAPWAVELEIMAENYSRYNEIINHMRRDLSDVLINVESTNMNKDYIFPAKHDLFE